MKYTYLEKIKEIVGDENVRPDELMAPHMSMKVGGRADYFVTPGSAEEIRELKSFFNVRKIPYYVIGNGTNVIIRDDGFRGVIICIRDNMKKVEICGNKVTAQAGVSLHELADLICEASLTGFEFASGIPGSLGGAVTMNAGAYDGEMKDVLLSVTAIDRVGNIKTFTAEEARLTYRHSAFSEGDYIITEATMILSPSKKEDIRAKMDELNRRRAEKQPLEYPSCGSTFKRPEGYYAGKLIMDAGLAGARVGGASVSEKHCGFVINDRGGSAADVLGVISMVQDKVREEFGVELECEVKVL